uniref:ADP-ribosylation factor-like protein n=1 Tax=Salmonella sp. s51228 TaxID=3159652 RepID=UPI0039815398
KIVNNPEMKSVPFIILANKQDEKKALKIEEIKKKIELDKISNFRRKWDILPCSAVNGEGVIEGLESLNMNVRISKEERMKSVAKLNRNNIRKSFRIKPRK